MNVKKFLSTLFCLSPMIVYATDVSDEASLNSAIITANGGGDATINFLNSITLDGSSVGANMRPVNSTDTFTAAGRTITIQGNNFTLNGASLYRGFFIFQGAGSVTINNLTFNNCNGRGGNSGDTGLNAGLGGGGGGFGGALFVGGGTGGTLTLVNPSFTNTTATGGSSGSPSGNGSRTGASGGGGFGGSSGATLGAGFDPNEGGSGGGGFNGFGGNISDVSAVSNGSGGGGALTAATSTSTSGTAGGNAYDGAGGGASGSPGTLPGANGSPGTSGAGGGGGARSTTTGGAGGAGGFGGGGGGGGAHADGGGGPPFDGGAGGNGGDFGGGGGGGRGPSTNNPTTAGAGGAGGFAGGGGGGGGVGNAGATFNAGNGGNGGFGGGGGGGGSASGGTAGTGGTGGFGGGAGDNGVANNLLADATPGGGGAGFGGALFLEDGADVVIQGAVTFSNNTTVGGTGANAGSTAGADIFMMSGSSLAFSNLSPDLVLFNPIEGDIGAGGGDQTMGGLTKSGSGTLTLTGDNTFTGQTIISGGELRIDSSIITETIINAGGLLSGNFTIAVGGTNPNSGNLTNSGTLSPGVGGVGTINIEGDYTQNASGTFLVDITPDGQSDRLFMDVANLATLDGTLDIIVNAGNYIGGTTYEIINAPVSGVFATVVQSGPLAGQIEIQVDYSSVILTILSTRIFQDQIIDSGVPSEVANCFTSVTITPGSDFAMVTELLGMLSNSAVNTALVGLSPVRFGALEWINERNNSYVADLLSQHLFELCCSPRDCCSCDCDSSVWINVFGNIMDNTKRLDDLRPFDANAVGALAGVDFCCDSFYYGASVGYTHTHLIWRDQGGKGNLDSYYGALYGSWQCDCFSADVSVIGGGTDQDLERRIVFTGLDRVAKSDPWGYFVTGHLGLRSMWDWCYTTFEPFAVGDYHYYTRQSFKEKGADSLNLNVRSKDQHFARGEAGLRVYSNTMSNCYCVAPYIGVSWVGEFPLHSSKEKAVFSNQDCLMNVESYDSSVQLASPQGGVKWTCCDGASLTLGYKGLFNNKTRINQVEGRFEWVF